MLDGNKIIVTVAINGGMQQDREGPSFRNSLSRSAKRRPAVTRRAPRSSTFTRAMPRAGIAVPAKSTRRSSGKSAQGHRF